MATQRRQPQDSESPGADLGTYVANLNVAVGRGITDIAAPHGLLPAEYGVLRVCLQLEECSATQLADIVPTDPSRISRIVTKLVDMGLLRRRRLRNDRRIVMLRLTDDGVELATQLEESAVQFYAALTAGVSEEDMAGFTSTILGIAENFRNMGQSR